MYLKKASELINFTHISYALLLTLYFEVYIYALRNKSEDTQFWKLNILLKLYFKTGESFNINVEYFPNQSSSP